METPKVEYIEQERETMMGRYRRVRIGDAVYHTGVERGRYKGKVFSRRCYVWHGFVRDEKGKTLWDGKVARDMSTRALLVAAKLLPESPEPSP